MDFLGFWFDIENTVKDAMLISVIVISVVLIIVILIVSIFKIRKSNSSMAIIVSALTSCVLMIPAISAFNNYVVRGIEGEILAQGKAEIREAKAIHEKLKEESKILALEEEIMQYEIAIAEQTILKADLDENYYVLKNSGLASTASFQKILEVALLQTDLKQTDVRKEDIKPIQPGKKLRLFGPDFFREEVLSIWTHDITAKFGIDLNQIKIVRLDESSIEVTGIHPKFIGSSNNVSERILNEIRRVEYKGDSPSNITVSTITVFNDGDNTKLAIRHSDQFEDEFQKKLSDGLVLNFMNDTVVELGKNFLKIMLTPLYENINFSDKEQPGALPLMVYLQNEINGNRNEEIESQKIIQKNEEALLVKLEELESARTNFAQMVSQ